ncbi:MAG: hypothetical protein ACXW00_07010 [Methylobacter sp.]
MARRVPKHHFGDGGTGAFDRIVCLGQRAGAGIKNLERTSMWCAGKPAELIPLTAPEVRKLLWQWLCRHPPKVMHIIGWSLCRKRHQAVARACHYRRRRQKHNLQL